VSILGRVEAPGHLLFAWTPTGYRLLEREGEPPAVGTAIVAEEGQRLQRVAKLGPSPLPADERRCAYLQPA
jgi:hypothetical protein